MWNSEPRTSLLRQLHALNRHFIEHLLAGTAAEATGTTPAQSLVPQLRALDAAALWEVCATPFTLYYLPFGTATYWQDTAVLGVDAQRALRPVDPPEPTAKHVTELAVFLAWHAACTDAASARLFFGMSTGSLEFFRHADVATLSNVAIAAAPVLQPRWLTNPYFWPDLIRCAGYDRIRMQATRLLGAQLLAAELYAEHAAPRLRKQARQPIARPGAVEQQTSTVPSSPP